MNPSEPFSNTGSYCFLVGSARSGTTFFSRLLGSHPEIAYIEESRIGRTLHQLREGLHRILDIKKKMTKLPCADTSRDTGYIALVKLDDAEKQAVDEEYWSCLRSFFEPIFRRHLQEVSKRVLLEKTPENAVYIEVLDRVFPGAKYIHLIRDGRDVLASYVRRDLINRWKVDLKGHDVVSWVSCMWRRNIEQAQEQRARLGDRYLEIYFDDAVENTRESARKALALLGLEWHPEMDRFLKQGMGTGLLSGQSGKYRQDLTPEQIARFEELNRDFLLSLGFKLETKTLV